MTKETHDFGVALPAGICSACLARLSDPAAGMPARIYPLADGRKLWSLYCSEHQAGAWVILGGGEVSWTIRTPIEIAQFHDYVATLPGCIAATSAALAGEPLDGDSETR